MSKNLIIFCIFTIIIFTPLSINAEGYQVIVHKNNKELNIQFENETDTFKESYSHILVSVGRKPNTQNIGLENVNIKTDNDFIIVDEFQKTSIPTIYAIGDVTGNPMLAHKATAQGKIAAEAEELRLLKTKSARLPI